MLLWLGSDLSLRDSWAVDKVMIGLVEKSDLVLFKV